MASSQVCEIMNSEIAGSILAVFPVRRKIKAFLMSQAPVKLNQLKTTMRAIRSLQVTPMPKTPEVKFGTGDLIRVPDIITWEICQV